jgi:hypothetical protein
MKHNPLLLFLLLSGCRYLTPAMPEVSAERPALLAGGDKSDPTRQQAPPGRPCLVECGPGQRCNEKTAECEVVAKPKPEDAGIPWLP